MRTERYFDYQTKISRKWWFVLSVVVVILLALIIFLPVYYTFLRKDVRLRYVSLAGPHGIMPSEWSPQCSEKNMEEFDCFPDTPNVSREKCQSRGCCWREDTKRVKCCYPGNYGYVAVGKATNLYNGFELNLARLPAPSRYGDDLRTVNMRIELQTNYRLRIKIYDPHNSRHEVEEPSVPESHQPLSNQELRQYSVNYNVDSEPFGIKVRRTATDVVMFDTTTTGFTYSNQFVQLTIRLPSTYLYGLSGQSLNAFRNSSTSIFISKVHSSVHPMYICMEKYNKAHGVLLLNSNAMEIELHPTPAITFRTIGGILDFYIFLGPTPEDVVQQYSEAVGRSMMPPYWSLGFQMGKNDYLSTDHIRWVLEKVKDKNVPQDVQSLASDYTINGCMFTLNKNFGNMTELSTDLYNDGMKMVLSIHPTICATNVTCYVPYKDGIQMGVFVKDTWSVHPIRGKIGKNEIIFPDFNSPKTYKWWKTNLEQLYSKIKFSGLWLEANEPYNSVNGSVDGCMHDTLNQPPFLPKLPTERLYDKTICMDSIHSGLGKSQRHYDLYNTYGHKMGIVTYQVLDSVLKKSRPLVISHSTFIGSGKYMGHWFGDSHSSWSDMALSLPAILHFNLFGIPYTGAAICGSHGDPGEELCLRWIQLGAFYPLARHHKYLGSKLWITKCNSNGVNLSTFKKEFIRVVQRVIERRYELLPYLYTLFHHAHTKGSTVARPLWHEFYTDNTTYNIEKQFLWGPALLISPVLEKGSNSVDAYFPEGWWYDYYTGEKLNSNGQWETLPAALYNTAHPINLHIFGGHILVTQKPALNTKLSCKNPMKLLVALNRNQKAEGDLFWDDGSKDSYKRGEYVYVTLTASVDKLIIEGHPGKKTFRSDFSQIFIQQVCIMGLPWQPDYVTIDNFHLLKNKDYKWNDYFKTLDLKNILISLTHTTVIHWFD